MTSLSAGGVGVPEPWKNSTAGIWMMEVFRHDARRIRSCCNPPTTGVLREEVGAHTDHYYEEEEGLTVGWTGRGRLLRGGGEGGGRGRLVRGRGRLGPSLSAHTGRLLWTATTFFPGMKSFAHGGVGERGRTHRTEFVALCGQHGKGRAAQSWVLLQQVNFRLSGRGRDGRVGVGRHSYWPS